MRNIDLTSITFTRKLDEAAQGFEVDRLDRLGSPSTSSVLEKAERTPEGFWKGEMIVASVGLYPYTHEEDPTVPPGETRVEYVDEATLRDEAARATLVLKPFIYEHIDEVTPENNTRVRIGQIGENVRYDEQAQALVAPWVVDTAEGVALLDEGVVRVSAGYKAQVVPAPGSVGPHGRYDALQRNRKYNHVALIRGLGRDRRARIRLDSGASIMNRQSFLLALAALSVPVAGIPEDADEAAMAKHVLDNVRKLDKDDGAEAKLDALNEKIDELTAERDKLKADLDDAKKDAKKADADDTMETQKGDSEGFMATLAFRRKCDALGHKMGIDGFATMTTSDLSRAVVTKGMSDAPEDMTDEYVHAAIDILAGDTTSKWDSLAGPTRNGDRKQNGNDQVGAVRKGILPDGASMHARQMAKLTTAG